MEVSAGVGGGGSPACKSETRTLGTAENSSDRMVKWGRGRGTGRGGGEEEEVRPAEVRPGTWNGTRLARSDGEMGIGGGGGGRRGGGGATRQEQKPRHSNRNKARIGW